MKGLQERVMWMATETSGSAQMYKGTKFKYDIRREKHLSFTG